MTFLTPHGYYIQLAKLTEDKIKTLKHDLTVVPFRKDMTQEEKEKTKFCLYQFTKDHKYIIVPRYYGISKFGKPASQRFAEEDITLEFKQTLRSHQTTVANHCISYIKQYGGGLLSVPCGFGKCLAPGTKILMYNKSIKTVENVVVGDKLMGDDETPRVVMSVCNGIDDMYRVYDVQSGDFFGANKAHILTLKNKNNNIIDISIEDFIKLDKSVQKQYKSYRASLTLGNKCNIEQLNIMYPKEDDLHKIKLYNKSDYDVRKRFMNLHILKDNTLECGIKYFKTMCLKMAKQLQFLCRSLGYQSTIQTYPDTHTYIVTKHTGNSYDIEVRYTGQGHYYGFELTGNGRFLLADLTVTHNTVCALYIAQQLSLKTLVVVHKSFLLDQWIERACEFLNITRDRIGIIRQKVCNVNGKDIVVGMIHTIAKKQFKNIFNQFGLVIYDEAHHLPCKFFSKAIMKTGARHTLALTATPNRNDGLIKVMYWFCGGTIYQERLKINTNVIVKLIKFKSYDKRFVSKTRWFRKEYRPDTGKMTTNLCYISSRNSLIVDIINHLRKYQPERKILVLSGRKFHLVILKTAIDKLIAEDIATGQIDEDEILTCFYTGDTSRQKRHEAEEQGDIIFATYDMAYEGLDIKHMNTVILASPKKDIIQATGRIMRTVLGAGDARPLIIDISDELDVMRNWAIKRCNFYKKGKYTLETYYAQDETFVLPNFDDKYSIIHCKLMYNFCKDVKQFNTLTKNNLTYNFPDFIDLTKVLHTATLTENDFTRTVVTDGTQPFDLDRDIKQQTCDEEESNIVEQPLKPKFNNKRSMFCQSYMRKK